MKLIITALILSFVVFSKNDPIGRLSKSKLNQTRRILRGKPVGETMPYMVYLRPASDGEQHATWTCGGVIIHERYILTSAACIEDIKHFYVVSGTNKWIPLDVKDNECIKYGAKKAIWKCVPKNYYFDGAEFENIRWMNNDIAIVKVEDDFNFNRRIKGCDYIPKMIGFNNQSVDLEKPKTVGLIAGWGSTEGFGDDILRSSTNSPELLETDVVLMSKANCKKMWDPRYHYIIDDSMICAKDDMDTDVMRAACREQDLACKDLEYEASDEADENGGRRKMLKPKSMEVHGAWHLHSNNSRRNKPVSGGFCENDHGGPLIVGRGKSSVVVGVISACMTRDVTKECYGPFLYTSVWKNRHLISCAIDKDVGATCRKLLRSSKPQMSETEFDWSNVDVPAKTNKQRGIPIPIAHRQNKPIEIPYSPPIPFRVQEVTASGIVTRNGTNGIKI